MRKKDKLYKVNKWNQPLFAQGIDREHQNIFDGMFSSSLNTSISKPGLISNFGYTSGLDYQAPQLSKPTSYVNWGNTGQSITAVNNSQNMLTDFKNSASSNNAFSQFAGKSGGMGGKAEALGAITNTGLELTGMIGKGKGFERGLWDRADPVHYLADGRESTVGNALGDAGVETFKQGARSGNGWTMLAGAGMKVLGGLTNAAFGIKTDKERLQALNEGIDYNKNFTSDAAGFDNVVGPQATVLNTKDVYKGGWFTGGKASRKNEELAKRVQEARSWADRSVTNNIQNLVGTQMDTLQGNYAAFGGPLNTTDNNMGAINYNFMSDYLTTKSKAAEAKNKVGGGNIFGSLQATPFSTFALGGDMQTNGGDYSNGLMHISAGGSHESNPYDGVQLGISRENGQPNLVEEGETVFDDYVFSMRIKPDARTKKKFHVGKNSDVTFADLSKRLEKESLERPNDPLSQAALKNQMHSLAEEQERQKEEQQAQEAQDAFAQLPPEQQQAIMQQVAMEEQQAAQAQQEQQAQQLSAEQQQQLAQQQPDAQQVVDAQMQAQQPQMEEIQMAACGGKLNRFDKGGDMKRQMYKALGLYTDADFEKWRKEQKLDEVKDWENITKNEAFMTALAKANPALGDVIGRGYDFGAFKASDTSPYDLTTFNDALDKYTASKHKGNKEGNYVIDDKFNLGKYKTIKELEASPEYKAYTDYMKGVLGRTKGIGFSYSPDGDNDYKSIVWDDPNKTFSEGDYNALQTLTHHAKGTATNPKGDMVPLWTHSHNEDGKSHYTFNNNADELFERYRTDGKGGIFHLTPEVLQRNRQAMNYEVADDGSIHEIIGDVPTDWKNVGAYNWQDAKSDYSNNYYKRPGAAPAGDKNANNGEEYKPKHRNETLRYAGLLGPAVGLGMQLAGVGKPDYSGLNAAVEASSGAPALAQTKYIGNYLRYNPMDIWYEQNRLNANSRATDRAIMNNGSPLGTKMAGLLANGYNNQISSGNLYRQALEYNDAQRQKVAEFNRGTDMFNAQAFNDTSKTNAQLQANHRNFKAQMMMDAAKQRMASDAAWNQGIYGNVSGLFKGISDLGKENAQHNMIADMAADGLFGNMSDRQHIAKTYLEKKKAANGGKVNRRKGRRGLTF